MKSAAKKSTGLAIAGGLLALTFALSGCAGSAPETPASPTGTYSSDAAKPIPQTILGMDPTSIPVDAEVKTKFGSRADTLAATALKLTQLSTDIPAFQDPTRVASAEDEKLLLPFKDMMTVDAYSNLTTQLSQKELLLVPNTDKSRADITVEGKKYTQQGKEFGFNYGTPTFSFMQGGESGGVGVNQEVTITIPTTSGNVVTMTDKRLVILEPGDTEDNWKVATWRVTRTTAAS